MPENEKQKRNWRPVESARDIIGRKGALEIMLCNGFLQTSHSTKLLNAIVQFVAPYNRVTFTPASKAVSDSNKSGVCFRYA
jgi:hypothetical protein